MRRNTLAAFLLCAAMPGAADQIEPRRVGDDVDLCLEPEEHADIDGRRETYLRRHSDAGIIDPVRMRRLVRELYERERAARSRVGPTSISGTNWLSVGPTNFSGRIRSAAAHPTTAGTFFIGAATGGVWKTTDTGATWTPLTDALANLTVGAVAVAPSNPNVIYLGTGEPVGSGIPGIGFLSSTNGGADWNFPGAGVLATSFWDLSVHPTNALDVLAATPNGGFRSMDGGANWTPWVVPMGTPTTIADIIRSPANANTLYSAPYSSAGKVLKSTDGGSNWTDFSTGLPASGMSRLSLAIDSTGNSAGSASTRTSMWWSPIPTRRAAS